MNPPIKKENEKKNYIKKIFNLINIPLGLFRKAMRKIKEHHNSNPNISVINSFWMVIYKTCARTVVKSEYQGRGIGRKLYHFHDECLRTQWFFWHHITKVENKMMLSLDESFGVIQVGSDGKFIHGFSPTRKELKIFNPIAFLLLRMFYVEKYRRIYHSENARAKVNGSAPSFFINSLILFHPS